MRRITDRAIEIIDATPGLGTARRAVSRALDFGVVALLLFIPSVLGNRAGADQPPAQAAPVASYCDSLCSGPDERLADED